MRRLTGSGSGTAIAHRFIVGIAMLGLLGSACSPADPSVTPVTPLTGTGTQSAAEEAAPSAGGESTEPADDASALQTPPPTPSPTPVPTSDTAEAASGSGTGLPAIGPVAESRIVVASAAGGIYLVDGDGSARVDLASAGTGVALHPVWRPDGRRVAWSLADATGFSVMSSNADGSELRRAQSPFGGYFGSWDPTSSTLGFLGPAAPGTGLVFDAGTGAAIPGVVDSDTFYFFSWSPDGRQWIVHSGSGFRIKGIDGSTTPLNLDGGRFRAPVWAPDGTILLTVLGPEGNVIVRLDPVQETASEIFQGGDETNFVLDPTGRYLAVQTTELVQPGTEAGTVSTETVSTRRQPQPFDTTASVVIIDLESGAIIDVVATETGGLWWSPDGTKLAILAPHAPETRLVHWTIWSQAETFSTAPFRLTQLYAQAYVPFFDQFAQSVTPWSPDGTRFVYPGISTDDESGIFVQEAQPGSQATLIAEDGILAFWSPT